MAELHGKYGKLLYSVILRLVKNRTTAEDVLQETFLRIWNSILTFDCRRGRLDRWIVSIARNKALDYLRSVRIQPGEAATQLEHLENSALTREWETEADRLARRRSVGAAFDLLNVPQRKVLELAYFEGLTQTEIAELLHKPLGTVKSLARSALKAMRSKATEGMQT
jgi:RNA polymerase sigma-70 factor (ECF subfamily)